MKNKLLLVALGCAVALCVGACSQPKPAPQIASSSGELVYAAKYPTELSEATQRFLDRSTYARDSYNALPGYPAQLGAPDWSLVGRVYGAADQAGRSRNFVNQMKDNGGVWRFYEDAKDDINKRVANAVSAQAAKKAKEGQTCEIEPYGAVSYSMKEAVGKKLEERLRAENQAQAIIEGERAKLPKADAEALEKQADDLALTSYVIWIELPELREAIERMVGEGSDVRSTLQSGLAAERERRGRADLDKAERAACEEKIAAYERAASEIDAAIERANQLLPGAEQDIPGFQKEYNVKLQELMDAVDAHLDEPRAPVPPAAEQPVTP